MNFIQKLYYSDKPIVLTNNLDACITADPVVGSYKIYHGFNAVNLSDALDFLQDKKQPGVIIEEHSSDALMAHLGDFFKIIHAGGGVVYNAYGELLMIFRRGKWDLAKGKLDEGETIEECSLREVQEETGVQELVLGDFLSETWHLYNDRGRNLVKHTTWYRMSSTDERPLKPQAEEDIMEARWVKPGDLKPFMNNTYKAIQDVLITAGMKW